MRSNLTFRPHGRAPGSAFSGQGTARTTCASAARRPHCRPTSGCRNSRPWTVTMRHLSRPPSSACSGRSNRAWRHQRLEPHRHGLMMRRTCAADGDCRRVAGMQWRRAPTTRGRRATRISRWGKQMSPAPHRSSQERRRMIRRRGCTPGLAFSGRSMAWRSRI